MNNDIPKVRTLDVLEPEARRYVDKQKPLELLVNPRHVNFHRMVRKMVNLTVRDRPEASELLGERFLGEEIREDE